MTSLPPTDLSTHNLTVIGAGTMGHGIAGQAARCGAQVKLYDTSAEALERGLGQIERIYQKTCILFFIINNLKYKYIFFVYLLFFLAFISFF